MENSIVKIISPSYVQLENITYIWPNSRPVNHSVMEITILKWYFQAWETRLGADLGFEIILQTLIVFNYWHAFWFAHDLHT